ncbi:hypothetical protein MFIFM68171_06610 [Madurella fahalii]|uniref:Low temperature requirement A n=1 Tax=Madurella fahalii TaxID=1157608 RepID=A0ABQ0GF52_9PEZI
MASTSRKHINEERTKRRIHSIVPWIQNPLQGVDKEHLVFAPRHEASTLELFFDLFFVANLATFTTYHAIVDHSSLFAYIGFFAIIWVTWFHTVLYDVRFENDSIYSRGCKTVIMIAFVGFALAGSAFSPGTTKGNNTNFRVLCYTLVLSRVLFIIQYAVVGVFVALARRTDIYLPLFLNTLTYVVAAAAYGAMIPAFSRDKPVDESNGIYSIWWIVMLLETIAVITISSFWRMLSFKKTHLVERMGLLTLIVIGEGAIGVTKTISRMMGKEGLDPGDSGLVLCIVLILIGVWMLYFDNHPHGHFGTIKQQIWSALHFPLHLAIVGLVEGSQQIALALYVSNGARKLGSSFAQYCFADHLDGGELTAKLADIINSLELDKKLASLVYLDEIQHDLELVGNTTGICGPTVTGTGVLDFPENLFTLYLRVETATYSSLGLSLPLDEDALLVMFESWKLVYRYFWAAFLLFVACSLIAMVLIRINKADSFYLMSYINRGVVILVAAVFLAISASKDLMYAIIETPTILPLTVGLLYILILFDRLGAWLANTYNRKSGDPLSGEDHRHGQGHDGEGDHAHGESGKETASVSADPLVSSPSSYRRRYNPLGAAVMPSRYGITSTAPVTGTYTHLQLSPLAGGSSTSRTYGHSSYIPVDNPRNPVDGH